ncbi:hypothetical protein Ahy_A03g013649 [Arachis hypogaea]|uniref:Aminotransferase-like plant mobile domain-containing protein n=1 Tax=Arachis hypogaea TaxID=3818 RepID=A0A445DVY2_ARAHY|nr:hypothetical protein Ahy_A03g013649 [Arachis hypogaea]
MKMKKVTSHAEDHIVEYIRHLVYTGYSSSFSRNMHTRHLHQIDSYDIRVEEQLRKNGWGSACLAHIYQSLCRVSRYDCKDMDGPLALLLVWAWIQMPSIKLLSVDTNFQLTHRWNDYQPTTEQYKNWTTSNVKRMLDDISPDGIYVLSLKNFLMWTIPLRFDFVWNAHNPNQIALDLIPLKIHNGVDFWRATVDIRLTGLEDSLDQDPSVEYMKLGASHSIVLTGPKKQELGCRYAKWISQWLNNFACVNMSTTVNHLTNTQTSILVNSVITYNSPSMSSKSNYSSKSNHLNKDNHLSNNNHFGKNNNHIHSHMHTHHIHTYHIHRYIHTHYNVHTHHTHRKYAQPST